MVVYLLPLVRGRGFKSYKGLYNIGYNLKTVTRVITFFIIFLLSTSFLDNAYSYKHTSLPHTVI